MQIDIATPDPAALIAEADTAIAVREDFRVTTAEEYVSAADKLKLIKGFATQWEDQRKQLKAPILDAGKKIDDLFRPAKDRLDAAEKVIKRAIVTYTTEQERIRAEAQRQADEVVRKERERLEAEARKAEAAAKEKAAEIERQAAVALEQGDAKQAAKLAAKADAVLETAAGKVDVLVARAQTVVAPVVLTPPPPKIKGLALSQRWYARVVDPALVPREYLSVNQDALDKVAQATKNAITIPGVEFYSETVAASTRR